MPSLARSARRRRTLTIISHPDANKTLLAEKLLLFSGAIQIAGDGRAVGRRARHTFVTMGH